MHYVTGMPVVVGEFDAERLSGDIDRVSRELGTRDPIEVQRALSVEAGVDVDRMSDLAQIAWNGRINPGEFVMDEHGYYHFDLLRNVAIERKFHANDAQWNVTKPRNGGLFTMQEVVTTTLVHQPEFLVGAIPVPLKLLGKTQVFDFWRSDEGEAAIQEAWDKGDVRPEQPKRGEVVLVGSGTLTRRVIPEHARGFDFYMRRYPRSTFIHSATVLSRLRPF